MSDDFHDFEIMLSGGQDAPAWMFRNNPFRCRAFRSAIEAAYGTIAEGVTLEHAFSKVRPIIEIAAERKIVAIQGDIDQPVPVIRSDVIA